MNPDAPTPGPAAPEGPPPSGAARPETGMSLARASVRTLLRCGVREVVVCAGARNAALVAVLAKTESLRLWSFPEERSAAFFALGRILALEAPVAVVTTSGTAAAELLPAAIEAFYQGLPLVLLTADRPRAYRGTGAPQAIEQAGLFSTYVAACGDVATLKELADFDATLAGWARRQPVQLNVCLEEPGAADLAMAAGVDGEPIPAGASTTADPQRLAAFIADHASGPLVAVVAALPARERAGATAFLRRLRCPVLAEATSGLRECPELARQLVRGGETALAQLPAGRVLRLGAVPSLRWWRELETNPGVRVLSLTPTGFPGLARPSAVSGFPDWEAVAVPAGSGPAAEPAATADPVADRTTCALALHPRSEPALVHALSSHLPRGSLVFLGNSLPIREWNAFASTMTRDLRCHANRGANGIDGCVSTFLGLGAGEPESWAVIGDLTALYDLAALWITPALPAARRRIVIINNGGGRIFSRVAALRGLESGQRRLMENPHALGFRAWATMFGWDHVTVTDPGEFPSAVAAPAPHLLIEIIPDAAQTEAIWQTLSLGPPSSQTASPPRTPPDPAEPGPPRP